MNTFYRCLFLLGFSAAVVSCDEDESLGTRADFAGIASSYDESEGTKSIIIPLRNANSGDLNDLNVTFDGTATEGTDFNLVGVTSEGVEISFIDDADFELRETLRVGLSYGDGDRSGNAFHTVTVKSNCEDKGGIQDALALYPHMSGIDANLDGLGFEGHGDVTITPTGTGTYTVEGLNVDFMENVWEEEIQESEPITMTVDANGNVTIAEQYIFTTLFDGDLYDYTISGTGTLDPCTNALVLDYEISQDGFNLGAWLHDNEYMTDPLFKATFGLGL